MAEVTVTAEVAGTVWKNLVQVGQQVEADQELMILESMKMEIPVHAPQAGTITAVLVAEQDAISEEQPLLRIG
ncbi:MAG: acetyl-CoA carboxylase biotin carboxyl carrier protein subunit [Burkholderiaceae bacterium]